MRKILIILTFIALSINAQAQIPNFARTTGDGILHGYADIEMKPNTGLITSSTALCYGIGKYYETGIGLSTNASGATLSPKFRTGKVFSKTFGIGIQYSPSFIIGSNPTYSHSTIGLYMNGCFNAHLYWASNTFWSKAKGASSAYEQWTYLGYDFHLQGGNTFSIALGELHNWNLQQPITPALGFYYMAGKWIFYLWSNNLHNTNRAISMGVEFRI